MAAEVEEVVVTPMRSSFSTCSQIAASTSSVGVRGSTYAFSWPRVSGAGSARRSSLPFGVVGAQQHDEGDGTM